MITLSDKELCREIQKNYNELKSYYPFSVIQFIDNRCKYRAAISVIAVCPQIVDAVNGKEEDFKGEYSRQITIFVPYNYLNDGCTVYGCDWVNFSEIDEKDYHFNSLMRTPFGFELCVGTPESFARFRNPILECAKTAENMLIGYERLMKGESDSLDILSFSHGHKGQLEFLQSARMS